MEATTTKRKRGWSPKVLSELNAKTIIELCRRAELSQSDVSRYFGVVLISY
jgi:hypothetical protein